MLVGRFGLRSDREVRRLHQFRRRRRSPLKGSAEFDAATRQYKITGTGTDIWAKADQFHYVWREMSGNFAVTATAKFLTEGIAHRKAVIMLRKSLDTDSPFVHLAIHGDGTPAVQFRNTKADNTNTVDFPIEGPGTWKLKLVRQGTTITVWIAKDGAPLEGTGAHAEPVGQPDITRTRGQLAYPGGHQHRPVFGCIRGTTAGAGRQITDSAMKRHVYHSVSY